MLQIKDKSKCCGCHACYNACPQGCISMKQDEEGFLYPVVGEGCIECGLCEKVCPFVKEREPEPEYETWAAMCKDLPLRLESSSGGIFSLLAEQIIKDGGKVFGAVFAEDWKSVVHAEAELSRIRTSKYLQSTIGDSYKQVKDALLKGEKVLFSGVPCQIAGLKAYLGKEYENLYCVDVICHGVPSPALWKNYLEYTERKYGGTASEVNFRHKKTGWINFGINKKVNETELFVSKDTDPFMQMFLRNYCLRPSCYDCRIKGTDTDADITLGDLWGINNIIPEMNDGNGTSAVVVKSTKGKALFDRIIPEMKHKQISLKDMVRYNSSYSSSVSRPPERENFFEDMNAIPFDSLAEKYCKPRKKTWKEKFVQTGIGNAVYRLYRSVRGGGTFEYGLYIRLK